MYELDVVFVGWKLPSSLLTAFDGLGTAPPSLCCDAALCCDFSVSLCCGCVSVLDFGFSFCHGSCCVSCRGCAFSCQTQSRHSP